MSIAGKGVISDARGDHIGMIFSEAYRYMLGRCERPTYPLHSENP